MTSRRRVPVLTGICQLALAVAIALAVAGCATQRPARLPGSLMPNNEAASPLPVVMVGAQASARLHSGKSISGEVTAVSDSSVTLGRVGNYGYQEWVILGRDIDELKAEDRSSPAYQAGAASSVLLTLVAIGAAALVAAIGHIPSN